MVPGEEHTHHCPVSPWGSEYHSRCGVSDNSGSVQLEIESELIPSPLWSHRSGHICLLTDSSVPSLLQLATRSLCNSDRRLSAGLVTGDKLCKSPLGSDRLCVIASPISKCTPGPSGTSVEVSAMVPGPSGNAGGLPTSTTKGLPGDDQPRSVNLNTTTGRVAYLRDRYQSHQLSEEAVELMLNSWRTKTKKSHDSLFRKWHCWCDQQGFDPISGPVTNVVNFLAFLHKEGYQYNSVNAHHSAISSVHEKVDGHDVGKHPLVMRMLKGIYHDQPPLPCYTCTWNVQTVFNYLDSLGDNDTLSLKQLTWKVAMLLALTRPS